MLKPGMFISDRYEIVDKVGSGGMADVYKAKCHRLNRFVAVKVLKQEFSDDKKFVTKFRGEAQSAAGLSHPNIVNVYDVGEDDGLYYIVMELVEGITLKSFIERKGKLEVKEAIGIAIQIALGLEAAHANHIIHRDIKPQNIIISREGKVKVTDFGIAKAANSNTITSNAMGSVHYISPEQARGGYSDERSDIYSLGVTMYEMLTGKVPFVGDNTVSVALQHIQGEAMPLRDLDPQIPPSIDRIVQKCMQKKPERRYLTEAELIGDLKQAITNPNGDFVKISPMVVNNSPTIDLTEDEVSHIKSAAKVNKTNHVPYQPPQPETRMDKTGNLYEENQEEEEEEDIDPKLEKLIIGGSIAAAVILVAIIVFLVVRLFAGGKKEPEMPSPSPSPSPVAETLLPEETATPSPSPIAELILVPNVTGKTWDESQELLVGLKSSYTEEPSDTYEQGFVMEQDLEAGQEVEAGTQINLIVSSGLATFKLLDVYSLPKNQADTKLEDSGISASNITHDYAYHDTIPVDSVIKTEPGRGSDVTKNDKVKVILSQGPEKKLVAVPDLHNKTEEQAKNALKAAELTAGDIKRSNSEEIEKGKVAYQDYSVGEKVEKGTSIGFTVSLGPKVVEPVYHYIASNVVVSNNPFDFQDEMGDVKIVLVQDGKSKTVFEENVSAVDFPLVIGDIEGSSDSQGSLVMYLNEENLGEVQTVQFTKVEQ